MTAHNSSRSDTEAELATVIAAWVSRNWGRTELLAEASPEDISTLWRRSARDLGLPGMLIPESVGGQGATLREGAVVAQELASALVPLPFLHSAVLCTTVALGSQGNDELLAELAAGEKILAFAASNVRFVGDDRYAGFTVDEQLRVSGEVRNVIGARLMTDLVVPTRIAGNAALLLVSASDPGVSTQLVPSLDESRQSASVQLRSAPSRLMAEGRDAEALLDQALSATIAILCSEAAAIAGRCLRETVSYTSMRTQFDRPVGSFQALKHRMADMWWRSIGAEAAAEAAITLASSGPLGPAETTRLLAAKVFTSEAAVNNAEEALQLHGGIGMTWEAGHHFYLKRAKADQVAFGATGRCLDAVADELGLTY